jgi:rhodanese-related sulfurtransferase
MSEIFSIPSEKVKDFINNNNDSVILDVRTEEEWNMVGKPDGEALNAKTIFISFLVGPDRQRNENFTKDFNEKKISKKNNILIICRSGVRSMAAAKLLQQQGYTNLINISDGFEGNPTAGEGWKKSRLPCK